MRDDFDETASADDWQQPGAWWLRPRVWLVAVLLVFVLSRLWLATSFETKFPDTRYYVPWALRGVDQHEAAYRDFALEYPPVAWWAIVAPRWIGAAFGPQGELTEQTLGPIAVWYLACFHNELLLFDLVCLGLTVLIGWRMLPAAPWVLPGFYTLVTLAQPHLLIDRLDIGLTMLLLLWFYCWLRSLDASPASAGRWACAAYLSLGLGISYKIMPVACVPYLLLAEWRARGSTWKFAARAATLAVAAMGPFVLYFPSAGWGVMGLFQYHSERGTNLDSIWSGIMLAAAKFGVPCHTYASHRGYDLGGDWAAALKTLGTILTLTMAAALGLWTLLRGRRYDRRVALDTALLVLLNGTVLLHVLSPQYLNWLLPMALLLALNVFPLSGLLWSLFGVLVAAIVSISGWLFPDHYQELFELQSLPVALTIARSACLVGLAMQLNVAFFAYYGIAVGRRAPAAVS